MLLIARAPVRISLGGGWTDVPAYYERHGGLVISATISHYVYTILTPGYREGLALISADYRDLYRQPTCEDLLWDSDLRLPRAIAYHFNIRDNVTIFIASQVPPGTGLGLSGSLAVSMIKALAFWCGLDLGPTEVAELASQIEIDKMGMPVGRQDQYASAFGGINRITFSKSGVNVEPLQLTEETRDALEKGLMLLFTGASRRSTTILQQQRQASQQEDRATLQGLDALKELGSGIQSALEHGDLVTFGELLHQSWMQKRQLAEGVTNPFLDQCYQVARDEGALGGKIMGAGGGGFMLLYCPPDRQEAVGEAMARLGLIQRPFMLENEGVQAMQGVPWPRPDLSPYRAPSGHGLKARAD